jgi:hypothetical protein
MRLPPSANQPVLEMAPASDLKVAEQQPREVATIIFVEREA